MSELTPCLSVYLLVALPIYLLLCLSVALSTWHSFCLSVAVCRSFCQLLHMSDALISICHSVCLERFCIYFQNLMNFAFLVKYRMIFNFNFYSFFTFKLELHDESVKCHDFDSNTHSE